MKSIVAPLLAMAGAFALLGFAAQSKPEFRLVAGKRYRFSGHIEPKLPQSLFNAAFDALKLAGGSDANIDLIQDADTTRWAATRTAIASETVKTGDSAFWVPAIGTGYVFKIDSVRSA